MYWFFFFITDDQKFLHERGSSPGLRYYFLYRTIKKSDMGAQVNWVLFFITDNQELGSPGFYFITDNQEIRHGSPGVLSNMGVQVYWVLFFITDNQEICKLESRCTGFYFL